MYGSHCDFLFLFHFGCYFELKKRRAGTRLRFYFIFEWECKTKKGKRKKDAGAALRALRFFYFIFEFISNGKSDAEIAGRQLMDLFFRVVFSRVYSAAHRSDAEDSK